MHTFKNQFIVLPNGEDIVDVIVGKLGKTSDINLFRASRDKLDPKQRFLGDKAYKGDEAIATPHKKLRKPKLPNSKTRKQKLSSRRIGVEHLIGRIRYLELLVTGFVWHVINMSK